MINNKTTEVRTFQEFVQKTCEEIFENSLLNIAKSNRFTLVLSGGRTPKAIFEELARNYRSKINWQKVHFFWLDERCVPPTHIDSNYKLANDHLISKLDAVGSVHRLQGEDDPVKAALQYQNIIKEFFEEHQNPVFDMVLLGMGEDGHVASIFPGSRESKLRSQMILATEAKHQENYRISMGLDLINNISHKLLLVNSEKKKVILDSNDTSYPINNISRMHILLFNQK